MCMYIHVMYYTTIIIYLRHALVVKFDWIQANRFFQEIACATNTRDVIVVDVGAKIVT